MCFSKLKIQICQLVINGEEDKMKIKNSRKPLFQDSCLRSADVHRQTFHSVRLLFFLKTHRTSYL